MGKKNDLNLFKTLYEDIVQLKRMNMGEIPMNILNTMDRLYKDKEDRPLLIRNGAKPYEGGWHFTFTLNPGCNYYDIEKQMGYFQSVIDGKVEMFLEGKQLHINVSTFKWAKSYSFDLITPNLFQEECSDMWLPIPVGIIPSGEHGKILFADMIEFSHLMLGGVNTSGKSTWIRILILFLKKYRPDVKVILIDFMRLDAALVKDAVYKLGRTLSETHFLLNLACLEVERRLKILEGKCSKASEYRGDEQLNPYLIIIDELAQLEDKDSQILLRKLSQTSRKLGVHLIVSLQRPSHTTYKDFTDSKAQFPARLSFKMSDRRDSEMILANNKAYLLKGKDKGRAIWQYDDEYEIQGLNISESELKMLVADLSKGSDQLEQPNICLLPR